MEILRMTCGILLLSHLVASTAHSFEKKIATIDECGYSKGNYQVTLEAKEKRTALERAAMVQPYLLRYRRQKIDLSQGPVNINLICLDRERHGAIFAEINEMPQETDTQNDTPIVQMTISAP